MQTPTLRTLSAVLVLAVAAIACDAGTTTDAGATLETNGETLNELASTLTTTLNLSTAQQTRVNEALTRLQQDRDPGVLWDLAAELQATLSDEQKATLLERPGEARTGRGVRQRGTRGPQGDGRGNGPGFGLNLTDEQRAALQPYREQMRDLHDQRRAGTLSHADFRTRMASLRDSMETTISEVLTDEQRARFETMRARRQERTRERRENQASSREDRQARRLEARVARQEALALTADQQAAFEALREEHRATLQALRDREDGTDRNALREEMRALRDAHDEAMAGILDARQLETLRIHRALVARTARAHRAHDGARGPRRNDDG